MKQRSVSAIVIVLVSVLPALFGGIWFAITIAAIMGVAFHEAWRLLGINDRVTYGIGLTTIVAAALAAVIRPGGRLLPLVLAASLMTVLTHVVFSREWTDRNDWSSAFGATWYLALPTFAAVALRQQAGDLRTDWFPSFADHLGSVQHAAGLAWFFLALFVTWASDTAAYLVGRSVGRTKLIPRVSPNKTVEGAVGGLAGAGAIAVICVVGTGLPVHPLTAIVLGVLLGCLGMLGDLSESMLKRRAGVKDSGNVIPGHGGVLDRVDAFIFILIATWALLPFLTS